MATDKTNEIMLNRAKAAVISRDFTLAARLYKGMLRRDPENLELLKALAGLYVKAGHDDQALPLYKKITMLDKDNLDALNNLGAIYRRRREYAESIAVLEQALVTHGDSVQVYYNLGFTYKLMGQYNDAIECFETVIDENPSDVLAYNHLASIYDKQKENDKAVETYLQGLKIDPNHPILHLNLARAYDSMGQTDKAAAEYENALRSKPGWLDAIDGYSDLLLRCNKVVDAKEIVQQALQLNPKNERMHTAMGTVYTRQADYPHAEREYQQALEITPESEKALSGIASAYEKEGKYTPAVEAMQKLDTQKTNDDAVARQYAHVLLSADKLDAAWNKIDALHKKNEADVSALNLLSQYYICKGQPEKTADIFSRIETLDPSYMQHWIDCAGRFYQTENYTQADKYAVEYKNAHPEDPRGYAQLAADSEAMGNYDEALRMYHKALEKEFGNCSFKAGIERVAQRIANSGRPAPAELLAPEEDANADFEKTASEEVAMDASDSEFEKEEPAEIPDTTERDEDDAQRALDLLKKPEPLTADSMEPVFNSGENPEDVDLPDDSVESLDGLVAEDQPIEDDSIQPAAVLSDEPGFEGEAPMAQMPSSFQPAKEPDMYGSPFSPEDVSGDAGTDTSFNLGEPDEPDVPQPVLHEPAVSSEPPAKPEKKRAPVKSAEPEPENSEEEIPEPEESAPEEAAPKKKSESDKKPVSPGKTETDDVPELQEEPDPVTDVEEIPSDDENDSEKEDKTDSDYPSEIVPELDEVPDPVTDVEEIPPEKSELAEPETAPDDGIVPGAEPAAEAEVPAESEPEPAAADSAEEAAELPEETPPVPDIPQNNLDELSELNDQIPDSTPQENETAPGEVSALKDNPVSDIPDDQQVPPIESEEEATERVKRFAEAARLLPQLVQKLINSDVVNQYRLSAAMFEKLRSLSEYLPSEQKEAFLASNTRLLLDYIIERLHGEPGLYNTAKALRESGALPLQQTDENSGSLRLNSSGKELALEVFSYMRGFIKALPDQYLASSLDDAVSGMIKKLK